jgi:ankyrin repeat protein
MSLKKLSDEEYSFLETLEKLDTKDVKNMCLVNKNFNNLCNQYLNSIYKKLLKRDFNINVPNNKVFQILYDLVNGINNADKTNVYYTSFLYKNLNTEVIYNSRNVDKVINVIKFTKNPDIQDVNGTTPLMLSVIFNKVDLFDEILKYNPNVNIKDLNNYNVLMHILEQKNMNMELFKKILSLNIKLNESEIYDVLLMLKGEGLKLFIKEYKKEMENYNILGYILKYGENDNIEYIIKEFYKNFELNKDLFETVLDNENLEIEQGKSIIKNLLKLNKIDKKAYVDKKIEQYIKQRSYDYLISVLYVFKESIKINDIIIYLLKNMNIEDVKKIFYIYDDININLKKDDISVFKYILKSDLDLWDLSEKTIINYNELIKDLDDEIHLIYLKEKLKKLETWVIENKEPKFHTDLFNLLTLVFMISTLKKNIGKQDVIKKTLETFKDNKEINKKIDINYWLSVV